MYLSVGTMQQFGQVNSHIACLLKPHSSAIIISMTLSLTKIYSLPINVHFLIEKAVHLLVCTRQPQMVPSEVAVCCHLTWVQTLFIS